MKKIIQHHLILLIVTVVVLLLVAGYVIIGRIAVNRYVDAFNTTYGVKEVEPGTEETVNMYRVPGYHELLRENGKLSGLVSLAKNDSIGLFLNLSDSVAQLMIKGVAVRNIPLRKTDMSVLFKKATQEALYAWLSEPVRVTANLATIDKEPVRVVQAPKDTSDTPPEVQPDTSGVEPVFFIMDTDHGLRLCFYQIGTTSDDSHAGLKFRFAQKWAEVHEYIQAITEFRIPTYVPEVRIELEKEDARALYRALPEQGQIVITF